MVVATLYVLDVLRVLADCDRPPGQSSMNVAFSAAP
jgi:hypothetical protein